MPIAPLRPPGRAPIAMAVLFALLASLPLAHARGGRGDDHERAHRAVQAGEVMPLEQVLALLAKDHPGQVLKIELEREDRLWVYEVKLLQPDGQLVKLLLDARTAEVLRQRRHH
ncbi:MAG: PepSY domain-containing protein [Burkholderiaceae bacterium]